MGIEAESKYVEQQMAEIERQEKIEKAHQALEYTPMTEEERTEFVERLHEMEAESPVYMAPTKKEALGANATKSMFVSSIYNWLIATMKKVGNGDYTDMFKVEGSSIICNLPDNYFSRYSIPAGTKIEMKFIAKKG